MLPHAHLVGQIYALVVTLTHKERPFEPGTMIEAQADVVIAPKPKRVIAVTPDYMDNTSQTELNTILSGEINESPVYQPEIKQPRRKMSDKQDPLQPATGIQAGGRDRDRSLM